jgi:hypothetical protein
MFQDTFQGNFNSFEKVGWWIYFFFHPYTIPKDFILSNLTNKF